MTAFSKLPTLIVEQIINITCEPLIGSLETWVNALPLLAVCSSWRTISKPIVYANAFIGDSHSFDGALSGNIDIITSVNSAQFVRNIAINVNDVPYLQALVGSKELIHYLRSEDWSGATSLNVSLATGPITYDADSFQGDDFAYSVKAFCNVMAEQVSRITDVVIGIKNSPQPYMSFGEAIARVYLHQLKSLKCSAELLGRFDSIPSKMAKLYFEFKSALPIQLPRINVGSLVQLEIFNAPALFDLSMLANSEDLKVVEFSNLVSLKVRYQPKASEERSNSTLEAPFSQSEYSGPKLVFPKLEKLDLFVTLPRLLHKIICSNQYCWPNVTSLALSNLSEIFNNYYNMFGVQLGPVETDSTVAGMRREFEASIFKCLQQSMPLITRLSLDRASHRLSVGSIYSQMALRFIDSLVSLNIGPETAFNFPRFSNNLASLYISARYGTWLQFPYINTRALQYLKLENVPSNSFWQIFKNSAESGVLSFNNLVSLTVVFDSYQIPDVDDVRELIKGSDRDSNKLSVLCPRLQTIFISGAHFSGLWGIFSNAQNVWSNVSNLYLANNAFNRSWTNAIYQLSADDQVRFTQKLESLNRHISTRAPNVSNLVICFYNMTEGFEYPFTTLVRTYSAQLKWLESNVMVKADFPRFSDNLHTLKFVFDRSSSFGLPAINAGSLEVLDLKALPSNFSWSWFKQNASDKDITFGKLFKLDLGVGARIHKASSESGKSASDRLSDANRSRQEVFMPTLRYANISIESLEGADWHLGIHMKNLLSLHLQGSFSCIAVACRFIVYRTVDNYTLAIDSVQKDDRDLFYETTNCALGNPNILRYASLILPRLPFDIDVGAVRWTYLSALSCKFVRFETMIRLLPRLASLKRLEYMLVPDYMPDLASVLNRANDPRSGDGCEDMVLSKSVTDLCISIARINGAYKSGMDDEEEMVVACCTYLILLMPNLHNVFINRPINWSLQDIVDDLADEFPHLSRLGD